MRRANRTGDRSHPVRRRVPTSLCKTRYQHPVSRLPSLDCDDKLLPAGRLREPKEGKDRANIVIVTKCPEDIKPMGFRVISKALKLYPYQKLFFSTLKYSRLIPLFGEEEYSLDELLPHKHVLLLTGIASPEQMKWTSNIMKRISRRFLSATTITSRPKT